MLVMRSTLPITDEIVAKDVQDVIAGFDLSTITNELIHSTMSSDRITKSMYELLACLHAIDTSVERIETGIKLGANRTIIHVRGVGVKGIGSDSFITTLDITSRELRFIRLPIGVMWKMSTPLGSVFNGVLNDIAWLPT